MSPVANFEQRMAIINKSKRKKEKMRKTFDLYDDEEIGRIYTGTISFSITDEGLIIDVIDSGEVIATVGMTADEWAEWVCGRDV